MKNATIIAATIIGISIIISGYMISTQIAASINALKNENGKIETSVSGSIMELPPLNIK